MGHLPFFQFYPADWIQDTQTLNHQAKGAWIDVLCQMWIAPERGILDWCLDEFTTILRLNNDNETTQMIAHLERVADIMLFDSTRTEVTNVENATHIKLINRRMVCDAAQIKARQNANLKYNDTRTIKKRLQNDLKTTPIYQKSEVRSHISEEDKEKRGTGGTASPNGFAEFWGSYPKKKSKGSAEKAWKALKPSDDLSKLILAGVARGRSSSDWLKQNGQFIPHPATWLRAKAGKIRGSILQLLSNRKLFQFKNRLKMDEQRKMLKKVGRR